MEETTVEIPPPPLEPAVAPVPTSLPDYSVMIVAAIEALNEASKSAIAKYIESIYGELPASHATLLMHHLNKMKEAGQLIMVKDNYKKPDPNAPLKRGRGRPPKPKDPDLAGIISFPPRPRGCPQKLKVPSGSGRLRGRPPKKLKAARPVAPVDPSSGGARRGRGRPPKVKPAVEPVAC